MTIVVISTLVILSLESLGNGNFFFLQLAKLFADLSSLPDLSSKTTPTVRTRKHTQSNKTFLSTYPDYFFYSL